MTLEEFEKAIDYLNEKNMNFGLEYLGISKGMLTFAIIYLGIILIILFIFVFLGIKAFSVGGTFGSIINSIIPAGYSYFFFIYLIF